MNSPILYGFFVLLLAGIIIWQVLSGKSFSPEKPSGDKSPRPGGIDKVRDKTPQRKWESIVVEWKFAIVVTLWIFFLFILWFFSDEVGVWNWGQENKKLFWLGPVVALTIGLTWSINRWTKTISILLTILLVWVLFGSIGIDSLFTGVSSAPVASAVAVKPGKHIPVTAPVGKYSDWVNIPPQSWFRIEYSGDVIRKDMKGREHKEGSNMKPLWLGDDDEGSFAFRFKSRQREPVVVNVYYHPK